METIGEMGEDAPAGMSAPEYHANQHQSVFHRHTPRTPKSTLPLAWQDTPSPPQTNRRVQMEQQMEQDAGHSNFVTVPAPTMDSATVVTLLQKSQVGAHVTAVWGSVGQCVRVCARVWKHVDAFSPLSFDAASYVGRAVVLDAILFADGDQPA